MRKFTRLAGVAAPLPLDNVDTDTILPARHMKSLTRDGLGRHLFEELRFAPDGGERAEFILNRPACRAAQILIAGRNFGCGSSREHAVWALTGYGIGCVIAPSFGEIFASNARKNGLLLIALPEAVCDRLRAASQMSQYAPMTIDLIEQRIELASGEQMPFAIDPADRRALIEGLDDIARTLRHEAAITRFEGV